jgi:hypothetical protein
MRRQEHQLDIAGRGPDGDLGCLCGEKLSMIRYSFWPDQRWRSSLSKARPPATLAYPDPLEGLADGQVRRGDHVPLAGAPVSSP